MTLPREKCAPYKLIQQHLLEENLSAYELSKKLRVTKRNVQQYLALLRENGLIRIAEYTRVNPGKGGSLTPLYGIANGKRDTPRPAQSKRALYKAGYYEKYQAEINAKKRAIRAKASGREVPLMTRILKSLGML